MVVRGSYTASAAYCGMDGDGGGGWLVGDIRNRTECFVNKTWGRFHLEMADPR